MAAAGSVPTGTRVGRYEILSLLGTGGMGEVYAAHDSNLGRQVALKILPSHRTSDPERVARFVREARASSALNHPAIVSVHDAGSDGDVHFLAMELIDGQSLSAWMKKSRKESRSIEMMAQVAEGLARAHANGIVHRDLKPDNIMITRDGYAKIVDFGVAKLTERFGSRAGHTGVTTPTSRIGTTAYMSPEQVEGKIVDHRADVFAFGTVLYELMAGKNPFASPQYADTLHNIVHLDPPLDRLSPKLRRIVRRCLRKDPDDRYQSMRDVALDLREVLAEGDERPAVKRWPAFLTVAAIAIVSAVSWYIGSRTSPSAPPAAMVMSRLTSSGQVSSAAISPDGRYLVYAERVGNLQSLNVKQIATGTTNPIIDPAPYQFYNVRVSPDSNYVYYSAHSHADPNILDVYRLPILGGTPQRIASDTEPWYALSPDGERIVFTRLNAFDREFKMTIASVNGEGEQVVMRRTLPEHIEAPVWAPDGKSLTFFSWDQTKKGEGGVKRLILSTGRIESVPTPTWPGVGSYTWLLDGSGALVTAFERDQPPQIWFVPAGSTAGRKITSEVSRYYSVTPTADSKSFVAVRDTTDANVLTVDLEGGGRPVHAVTSGFGNICGVAGVKWLNNSEILYSDIEGEMNTFFAVDASGRGEPRRLIRGMPSWRATVSRDGRKIAFVSDKSGQNQIWIADADGQNARQLSQIPGGNPTFTPDGKDIVYISSVGGQFATRIGVNGKTPAEPLTNVPTSRALVSPDGRWLLTRLRTSGADGPLWQTAILRTNGEGVPRYIPVPRYGMGPHFQWHPDGSGFLFLDTKDGVGNVWFQPLDGGEPRQLTSFTSGTIFAFDVSPDGKRLAVSRGEPTSDAVLVRNWR
jgi:eukaryotic-like serine/threonine-protein kinase